MQIKQISAKKIEDTRGEKTIEISISTTVGNFSASAPNGKSTGEYEAKSYKKSIEGDITSLEKLQDYLTKLKIKEFEDLKNVEGFTEKQVGANTQIALEFAILKALAEEHKKEVYELFSGKKKIPEFVANIVGGGKHSKAKSGSKPDFQEFLIITKDYDIVKKVHEIIKTYLKDFDKNFKGEISDENAWQTSLNEKQVFEVLNTLQRSYDFKIGTDVAASEFYSRNKYRYKNPPLDRGKEEQVAYIANLIKNFDLFYIEDPLEENDFKRFAELQKKCKGMIVGDDLTTTNPSRISEAIENKSIKGVIIKPNQIGSLIKVKESCDLAKKNNIKIIFSHRSGETSEEIIADLAIGLGADYVKFGALGLGREEKIKRVLEIRKIIEE